MMRGLLIPPSSETEPEPLSLPELRHNRSFRLERILEVHLEPDLPLRSGLDALEVIIQIKGSLVANYQQRPSEEIISRSSESLILKR